MPKRVPKPDPKSAALRAEGTFNPASERVADPKFRTGAFFDPRDLVQVRYEMLRRVRVDDVPAKQAAAEYGVSRPTYYEASANFEAAGIAGLSPKKRGPRGPHKLTGELRAFVLGRIAPHGPLRARELARAVWERFSIAIDPRTIERAFVGKKTPVCTPTKTARQRSDRT